MLSISQLAGAYALALMTTLAPTPSPDSAASSGSTGLPRLWAGHQVIFGRREVPFRGEVQTRMDSFVLARMTERDGLIELSQTACHVRFSKVAGVAVHMNAQALPETRMVFATNEQTGEPTSPCPRAPPVRHCSTRAGP